MQRALLSARREVTELRLGRRSLNGLRGAYGRPRGGASRGRGCVGAGLCRGGARLRRRRCGCPSCGQPQGLRSRPPQRRRLRYLAVWQGRELGRGRCVKSFLVVQTGSLKLLTFRAGAARFVRRESILKLFVCVPLSLSLQALLGSGESDFGSSCQGNFKLWVHPVLCLVYGCKLRGGVRVCENSCGFGLGFFRCVYV